MPPQPSRFEHDLHRSWLHSCPLPVKNRSLTIAGRMPQFLITQLISMQKFDVFRFSCHSSTGAHAQPVVPASEVALPDGRKQGEQGDQRRSMVSAEIMGCSSRVFRC